MEGIQLRSINEPLRIGNQDLLAVFIGIDNHSARITKPDLEDRVAVLAPPLFAYCSMVVTKLS
jgi:N-acyl-L-homoserine lactone synthetase